MLRTTKIVLVDGDDRVANEQLATTPRRSTVMNLGDERRPTEFSSAGNRHAQCFMRMLVENDCTQCTARRRRDKDRVCLVTTRTYDCLLSMQLYFGFELIPKVIVFSAAQIPTE